VTFLRAAPWIPVAANNGDNWWANFGRAFVNGVVHGVRQPGQSFTQCVLQNANTTTGGAHGLLLAGVVGSSLSEQAFNYSPGGPGTASLALTASIYAQEISPALGTFVGRTLAYGSEAAPYLAAAEAGLLIGSAINCR
jgi:hypothetical protein